jgi:hypothetical protein
MKAVPLLDSRRSYETLSGRIVVIEMDLYKLPDASTGDLGSQFRFSWIAFDEEAPNQRVLFDCHAPKGMHFHLDEDKEGRSFTCASIAEAIQLFQEKVKEHFGELQELPNDGGNER